MAQPRWMLARGILGSGRTRGASFRPFPNSSGWWWLISSVFLIRISCHKTTHANGYYGARVGGFNQCASPNRGAICICMKLLTKQGWSRAYTIVSDRADQCHTSEGKSSLEPTNQHSLIRAQQSYKSLVQMHEKLGCCTPLNEHS